MMYCDQRNGMAEMNNAADKVVSYDSEELILVDEHDNEVGSLNKVHSQFCSFPCFNENLPLARQ